MLHDDSIAGREHESGPELPPPSFPAGGSLRLSVGVRDREALLAALRPRLESRRGFTVATLNLDHLVKLRRSGAFRCAYLATDFVVADGNPIVWLARLAGRPVALAPGSELVEPLCDLAAATGAPVALVGSTDTALARAAVRLAASRPALEIALRIAPPQGFDPQDAEAEAVARRVAASGARLCLLALGAPKQEAFAVRAARLAPACGFVSVGAGLDFIAGAQRRAPLWARRLALEWLWRLVTSPGRLGGRYARCALILPGLVIDALRERRRARRG